MPALVYIPKSRWWSSRLSTLPIIPLTRTTQHLQLDRHLVAPRNIVKFNPEQDQARVRTDTAVPPLSTLNNETSEL